MILINITHYINNTEILIPYLNNGLFQNILLLKFDKNDASINFYENKFKFFVTLNECFKQFIQKLFNDEKILQNLVEGVLKYALANVEKTKNEIDFDDFIELVSEYAHFNDKVFKNAIIKLFDIIEINNNANNSDKKNKNNEKINENKNEEPEKKEKDENLNKKCSEISEKISEKLQKKDSTTNNNIKQKYLLRLKPEYEKNIQNIRNELKEQSENEK